MRGIPVGMTTTKAPFIEQAQKRGELFLRCVGVQRELKPYVLDAHWNLLRQTQSSSEVEITFRLE